MPPAHPHRSPAAVLMTCAVPVAAMLSFAVQPMMGKRLLPISGGSSVTWLGAMIYFQMALLLGYGWATWLLTKAPQFQRRATLVLAGLALATFRLPALDTTAGGIAQVIWILSLHSLPAMMLLFGVSPLMHGWLQHRGAPVPYYVYAISNLGSLVGLISYPFLIEPAVGIGAQRWLVHGGIALVSALIGAALLLERGTQGLEPGPAGAGADEAATRKSRMANAPGAAEATPALLVLSWIGLSLVTCVAMLGATGLLAAEVGSTPLAWVGPFGAYLLSFTVVFSGRWRNWMTAVATICLIVGLTAFLCYKGSNSEPLAGPAFVTMMIGAASACFVGNALLYRLRPAVRFDRFYLALAIGGVAGGLLITLVLPYVLPRPIEFELAVGILLLCGVLQTLVRSEPWARGVAVVLTIVPVLGTGLAPLLHVGENGRLEHFRNEYGYMFTRTKAENGQSRIELFSETTIHGTQLHVSPDSSRRPTLYYSESGGAGRTILQLRRSRPTMRIGVVGLGTGTLAAYGVPGDEIHFWEIDPKAVQIAQTRFSYLRESQAKVEVSLADGRRGLAAATGDFDLIIVDAFSGDSVPAHLVTVEAMQIYFARLTARKGVLVIHGSSRYNEVFPVLSHTALVAGRPAIGVVTLMQEAGANWDWDPISTEYVIVPPPELMAELRAAFPETEENGRVKRFVSTPASATPDPNLTWTDDRHAAIDMFNLSKFLHFGYWFGTP